MRRDENELLCRVGPGTPMGAVFRRYWSPIADAKQLAEPDGDPLRVRFCGEDYVAFRDTAGKLGLLDELCAHRGTSLALGRNEDCGLRCLYHGWKFAVDGSLLDTPNHPDPNFRKGFKANAYPIRETGGLIWGYFGPQEKEPPFPDYAFMSWPAEQRYLVRVDVKCNYLQLLEGGMDSSHVGILHADVARPGWNQGTFSRSSDPNNPGSLAVDDNAPTLAIETTTFGFHYAAIRKGAGGGQSIRIVPFILPCGRIIPAPERQATLFEVPIDDETTSTYLIAVGPHSGDRPRNLRASGLDNPALWSEPDRQWRGTWENRFGQDRQRMRTKESWSGFRGFEPEDAAVALSMGPIFDRTREHLVPADGAVVHLRRVLLDAARRIEAGEEPPRLPSLAKVAAVADTEIAPGARWQDLAPGNIADGERIAAE
jgi:phenylpropionate dioxygenase-like ring-hydroxylating dioxygenase large terminal subunit